MLNYLADAKLFNKKLIECIDIIYIIKNNLILLDKNNNFDAIKKNLEDIKKAVHLEAEKLIVTADQLLNCGNKHAALEKYKDGFSLLLRIYDEKLPMLSDSFLSHPIVRQIPIFEIHGKYKHYSNDL